MESSIEPLGNQEGCSRCSVEASNWLMNALKRHLRDEDHLDTLYAIAWDLTCSLLVQVQTLRLCRPREVARMDNNNYVHGR